MTPDGGDPAAVTVAELLERRAQDDHPALRFEGATWTWRQVVEEARVIAAFLARYRERTGLSEEQVNENTVSYFYVLGMARLLGQMFEAADALAQGRSRGVMATYMMNGTSATTRAFVEVAHRLAS